MELSAVFGRRIWLGIVGVHVGQATRQPDQDYRGVATRWFIGPRRRPRAEELGVAEREAGQGTALQQAPASEREAGHQIRHLEGGGVPRTVNCTVL